MSLDDWFPDPKYQALLPAVLLSQICSAIPLTNDMNKSKTIKITIWWLTTMSMWDLLKHKNEIETNNFLSQRFTFWT